MKQIKAVFSHWYTADLFEVGLIVTLHVLPAGLKYCTPKNILSTTTELGAKLRLLLAQALIAFSWLGGK